MIERPVLMNGEMVRAMLREVNPKTQTRRPIKPQPISVEKCRERTGTDYGFMFAHGAWCITGPCGVVNEMSGLPNMHRWKNPLGVPGDRLWVRETWSPVGDIQSRHNLGFHVRYKADEKKALGAYGCTKWRPSIHMPRWASRINLLVKSVRVERVQDISADDCLSEGIEIILRWEYDQDPDGMITDKYQVMDDDAMIEAYEDIYDSIYGDTEYCWAANPWVFVTEFEQVEG